jgi:hypothetical protein
MVAWTSKRAPNVSQIVGKFLYTTPEKISKWHLMHPTYGAPSGTTVQEKWGRSESLHLAVTEPGKTEQYKKKVIQTKYLTGQTQALETLSFWLPVLFECDPVLYDNTNTPRPVLSPRGSYTGILISIQTNILHLPISGDNTSVTDTYKLGQYMANDSNKTGATRFGNSGGNPKGVHIANYDGFDYYWSDDPTSPDIEVGTVTSTGPVKTSASGSILVNPYSRTVFSYYGKSSTAVKLFPQQDLGQLYEWSSITVNGKTITPGMPFTAPGQTSGLYVYSAYAIKNVSDPEQPAKLLPIVVTSTNYNIISNWKNASSQVAVAPNVPAAVVANLDLNQYMAAGKTTFASGTVNGVQTVSGWNGTAGAEFVDKYIVYPSYKFNKSNSEWSALTLPAIDSQARFVAVGLEDTSRYSPAKGKHLGAYNSLGEANQWRDYYNSVIKSKIVDSITTLPGYVFALGNSWNDNWGVNFNVEGMSGIRSKDSLSKVFNAPAIVSGNADEDVDLSPTEANQGQPSVRVTIPQAVTQITKSNVTRLITSIMATEKLSFQTAKTKFKEEFIKARIKLLISQDVPRENAIARANARAEVLFAGAVQGSNTGGSGTTGSSSTPSKPTSIRIPITRGLIGYQPPPSAEGTEPQLVQKYQYVKVEDDSTGSKVQTLVPTERRFVFPFAPKDVSYSNLSSVWTEINRTGRHPIVDWSGFQLLKVSFTFELVDKTSTDAAQPRDGFGLYYSVDEKINLLRQMAIAPYPVSFLNMDTFFSKELRYPLFTQGRGVEFVITDFAVQSVQRTPPSNQGPIEASLPNQISRASCTMTLQECPIEQVDIVNIPPITVCGKDKCPPVTCKVPCVEVKNEWLTLDQLLTK